MSTKTPKGPQMNQPDPPDQPTFSTTAGKEGTLAPMSSYKPALAPTPRTDAAASESDGGIDSFGKAVPSNFARNLETELAAEREKVRVLREALESLAYWSRNKTESRITLRNLIAAALAATEESK